LVNLRHAAGLSGHFELGTVAATLFVTVPVIAFRGDGTVGITNSYVHLLGFALGYVAAYITTLLESRTRRGDVGDARTE